jgi:hypothetical protein
VDLGYEKRRVATLNFGLAEKVILGKYHLAFHSAQNMCRKISRGGMKIVGMKNYAAGKGQTLKEIFHTYPCILLFINNSATTYNIS